MKKFALLLALAALMPLMAMAQEVRYVDATSLTVINKPQSDQTPLQRLDVDRYPDLTKTVRSYYRYSTGVAVVFRTDSRNILARWTTKSGSNRTNTPMIALRGLDMYILRDGQWVWAGFGNPSLEGTEHEDKVVESMDGSMHECLLYLPLFTEVTSLQIGVDEGAVIEGIDNPFAHKILVIGSSITHGVGVSRPGMAYPARLERQMGLQFANLGANGQCKLENFFAQIAADTDADAFIFDGFSNPSAEQIEERLADFVKVIREAHPHTPLIFLQTEIRTEGTFNLTKGKFEADKRAAAEREMKKIMAQYRDVYFINPGMPLGNDDEALVDGIHPTDLGFERILSIIVPQLEAIFRQYDIL